MAASLHARSQGKEDVTIKVPQSCVRILFDALKQTAEGHSVVLQLTDTELTTQLPAELMSISRPSVIKKLDRQELPCRKAGVRIRYEDMLHYLDLKRARRRKVTDELVEETERLGLD